ncbi:MAG: hypothetical protein ACRDJG_06735 [Actinomycetota bacterium]
MEFVVAVFAFGSLLLLAGVVGGGLTYRGATLPKLGRLPRFTLTTIGGALVIASGLLWLRSFSGPETSTAPRPDRPAGDREATITLTLTRELPPFHHSERLDVFVDQRRVGSLEVGAERPLATIEITLQKGGAHQYDARLMARLPGGDPSEFSGSGVLETEKSRRFRVLLNRSSASVEIVPE